MLHQLYQIRRPTLPRAAAPLLALILWLPSAALAVPVNGHYVEDPRCDTLAERFFTHELGEIPFPLDERFNVVEIQPDTPICVADDGMVNDFVVSIANMSGIAYTDLFFVADDPFTVGNADGTVEDVTGDPGDFRDAFRIDGTVTVGVNNPLVFESAGVNEIFEPGEIWVFRITNFTGGAPVFDSVGVFAGSSVGSPPSNASIVAILPEPGTLLLLASGLAGLAAARRGR